MIDIQRLLAEAPPGTVISVVSITVPGPVPSATETASSHDEGSSDWTQEQVVEWVRDTHGPLGLKLRDWVSLLPMLSVRELKRAIHSQSLVWHTKPNGKDHGATMIGPDAMMEYLQNREAPGTLAERPPS